MLFCSQLSVSGGLASREEDNVRVSARRCLLLWDSWPTGQQHHDLSRRFLDPTWGQGNPADPSLRPYVLRLAAGETMTAWTETDQAIFGRWTARFRHAAGHYKQAFVSPREMQQG